MSMRIELASPDEKTGLKWLTFSTLALDPRDSTEKFCYPMAEAVYFVVGGYGIFSMMSSGARFDYPVQQGTGLWLSDSAEHYLHNDGEGPLRCVCVVIKVTKKVQERGKEVQRRMVSTNDLPIEFVDQGGTMKVLFRGQAIGSERIDTVEYLATPPGGHKPEHYNQKIEGFVYFTRGSGTAAVGGEMKAFQAGDLVSIPIGARREYAAAPNAFVECFVLNVLTSG